MVASLVVVLPFAPAAFEAQIEDLRGAVLGAALGPVVQNGAPEKVVTERGESWRCFELLSHFCTIIDRDLMVVSIVRHCASLGHSMWHAHSSITAGFVCDCMRHTNFSVRL